MDLASGVWGDVFVGLVGGFLVAVVNQIAKIVKNKRLEKKFPISGRYVTEFEDEENGEKISYTALANLKQEGKKIKGITTENGRKYILEGEISSGGHIHGIYYSEDPIDMGVGNFFLKIDGKRNMFGLWSGYDSINDKINSGRYIFKPIKETIEIKNMEKLYFPHIIAIADKQLGSHYVTIEMLNRCIENPEKYVCKVAIDTSDKRVVGFYISYILLPEEIDEIVVIDQKIVPRMLKCAPIIGVIKTVAVDGAYQGKSVGTSLCQDSIEEFLKRNVRTICTVAWKSIQGTNLKGVLKNLKFDELVELKEYWKEDSVKNGFDCPVCGKPPCVCSAVIYGLNIIT